MAVTPIQFIRATSATATNGSDTIQVSGNVNCSSIKGGVAVQIGDLQIVEGIDGTVPDGAGNSTIKLRFPWSQPTTTSSLIAFNSYEGLAEAIRRVREITQNISGIDELNGVGYIYKQGDGSYALKASALDDDTIAKIDSVPAMTKEDFFALAENRMRDNAGSGFTEWGKDLSETTAFPNVNSGMWVQNMNDISDANILLMGRQMSDGDGVSRTAEPIVTVNGVQHNLDNGTGSTPNTIKFPSAPDGTKTYDSADGSVTQYADSVLAFASENATNKVIISRQDLVLLETWHEEISEKDIVYPLGNVQYGASSYEGITLNNSLVAQGYSAFGGWDTATQGYGARWSTLTGEQKTTFLQDYQNNIYVDNGKLIQVRYRIRVIEGLGDKWENNVGALRPEEHGYLGYHNEEGGSGDARVAVRGKQTSVQDYALVSDVQQARGYISSFDSGGSLSFPDVDDHVWQQRLDSAVDVAYERRCFAIPIALVQRRNVGAYHPTYNSNGSGTFWNVGLNSSRDWYETDAVKPNTEGDCFDSASYLNTNSGFIASGLGNKTGRSDNKFFDAIYASDVQDLRMSSRRRPLAEIREEYKRKAMAGEVRGFEGVPFTKVFSSVGSVGAGYTIVNQDNPSAVIAQKVQYHSQANPTWTDIIGSPENIALTFPDGVEGQWIPVIPTGVSATVPLNRKSLTASLSRELTVDNGATWSSSTQSINQATNSYTSSLALGVVILEHYETQARFTESSTDVVGSLNSMNDWVISFNSNKVNEGCLLSDSLGKGVQTGADGSIEHLNIERIYNGVIENKPQGLTDAPMVSFGVINDNSIATIAITVDDSGVLNCESISQTRQFKTQYFIDESN